MSDLKAILDSTKKIEALIEQRLGGSGRGLHEKLSNAKVRIPEPLTKKIRYIASIRNKTVHEDGFEIEDMGRFLKTCEQTIAELEQLAEAHESALRLKQSHKTERASNTSANRSESKEKPWLWGVFTVAGLVLMGLIYLFLSGANSLSSDGEGYPQVVNNDAGQHEKSASAKPVDKLGIGSQGKSEGQTRHATPPAEKPKRSAAVEKESASESSSTRTASQQSAASPAGELIAIQDVKIQYGKGPFGDPQARVTATFTNHSASTIANLSLAARMYINGEESPLVDAGSRGGTLFGYFGERGLPAGQTRTITMTADRMQGGGWTTPDAANATSRRVQIAVVGYTDGSDRRVKYDGKFVSSPTSATNDSGKASKKSQRAAANVGGEPLTLSQIGLQMAKGAFNESELRVSVRVSNNTDHTIANARLGALLYLNNDHEPRIRATGGGSNASPLFAYFGQNGLQSGESRVVTISLGRMSDRIWTTPDVLNADSRRVRLAVMSYTDGREQQVTIARDPASASWN